MKPGIMAVQAEAEREINADLARLHLRLTGEKFAFGNAAKAQSKEIKKLVEAITAIGIPEEALIVESVTLATGGSLLSKSSQATFNLILEVEALELMGEVLGAVSEGREVALNWLEWVYDTEDEVRLALVEEAMTKLHRKAVAMAEALDGRIVGIRRASDNLRLPEPTPTLVMEQQHRARSASVAKGFSEMATDLGTDFRAKKKLAVAVAAEFWVSKRKAS